MLVKGNLRRRPRVSLTSFRVCDSLLSQTLLRFYHSSKMSTQAQGRFYWNGEHDPVPYQDGDCDSDGKTLLPVRNALAQARAFWIFPSEDRAPRDYVSLSVQRGSELEQSVLVPLIAEQHLRSIGLKMRLLCYCVPPDDNDIDNYESLLLEIRYLHALLNRLVASLQQDALESDKDEGTRPSLKWHDLGLDAYLVRVYCRQSHCQRGRAAFMSLKNKRFRVDEQQRPGGSLTADEVKELKTPMKLCELDQ
jgi:hypothetical protein